MQKKSVKDNNNNNDNNNNVKKMYLEGLNDEILSRIKKYSVNNNKNVVAPANGLHSVWCGASLLGKVIKEDSPVWVSREEYEERGPLISVEKRLRFIGDDKRFLP